MTAVTAALVIAAVAAAASTGLAVKAQQEQKKAAKKQDKLAALQNRREQRKALRERFAEQARLQNLGANQTGQVGSLSGISGGVSSAAATAGGEVGFVGRSAHLSKNINQSLTKANNLQGFSNIASSVSNLALSGASFAASRPS